MRDSANIRIHEPTNPLVPPRAGFIQPSEWHGGLFCSTTKIEKAGIHKSSASEMWEGWCAKLPQPPTRPRQNQNTSNYKGTFTAQHSVAMQKLKQDLAAARSMKVRSFMIVLDVFIFMDKKRRATVVRHLHSVVRGSVGRPSSLLECLPRGITVNVAEKFSPNRCCCFSLTQHLRQFSNRCRLSRHKSKCINECVQCS